MRIRGRLQTTTDRSSKLTRALHSHDFDIQSHVSLGFFGPLAATRPWPSLFRALCLHFDRAVRFRVIVF